VKLGRLFAEEEKVAALVREVSQGLLDLDEFVLAKSPLELAKAEVIGRRIRRSCDQMNEHVHEAKKVIGALMLEKSAVRFRGAEKALHEMESELAQIHGDIESIGSLAESFYSAENREVVFQNLNAQYAQLMRHVMALMATEAVLK